MHKKLVLFGAGKIGRSFIGQLFSSGGYEVVFVDVFQPLIDDLNKRGSYKVIIKGNTESIIEVANVRGVFAGDEEKVIDELSNADIVATAVGQSGLPEVFSLLATGLFLRNQRNPGLPLDIIIAENLRNAAEVFETELKKLLPESYPFNQLVGLVETSIGKMVPLMTQKDIQNDMLQVFAEPYNTLIIDKKAFKNPIPAIKELAPKENIKAWVDRKLFIHNLGHATSAYLGYQKNPEWKYLYEGLADPEILILTRNTMFQSAEILMALYPGEFTFSQNEAHIDDLLERFQNKALGDTIYRVGCDLYRKLGPNDRLAGPIRAAKMLNMRYDCILDAVKAALNFRATDENRSPFPADEKFFIQAKNGIDYILRNICMINESPNG